MTITILGNPQFSYYSFLLTTSLKFMKKNPTLPFKFSWKPIYNNNSNKNKNKNNNNKSINNYTSNKKNNNSTKETKSHDQWM